MAGAAAMAKPAEVKKTPRAQKERNRRNSDLLGASGIDTGSASACELARLFCNKDIPWSHTCSNVRISLERNFGKIASQECVFNVEGAARGPAKNMMTSSTCHESN
jgi:hypothetical protein